MSDKSNVIIKEKEFYRRANEFWGFSEFPFTVNPNFRFLYISPQLKAIIERTIDSIDTGGGLSAVWGEVGMGKTTLAYYIWWRLRLERPNYLAHFIPDPTAIFRTRASVYRYLVSVLGGEPKHRLEPNINFLIHKLKEIKQSEKRLVIFIDEVQDMSIQGLKTLWELTNLETFNEKHIHFVLFGSSEVFLKLSRFPSVQTRIVSPSLLVPFTEKETVQMITFRLRQASLDGIYRPVQPEEIIPRDVALAIHRESKGQPRNIVRICHDALEEALRREQHVVDGDILREVVNRTMGK